MVSKKVNKTRKNKQTKQPNTSLNNKKAVIATYDKSVQEPWFSLIKTGTKKVEGRPNKGMFAKFKKGDIVNWTNDITGTVRNCLTKITNVRYYNTFYDMINTEKLENVLPATGVGINTVADGVNKVYRQWYSAKIEKEYGVIAIEVKVIG